MVDWEIRLGLVLVLLCLVCALVAWRFIQCGSEAKYRVVRARVRQEVNTQYQGGIAQARGLKKLWLFVQREREISRRVDHTMFGR